MTDPSRCNSTTVHSRLVCQDTKFFLANPEFLNVTVSPSCDGAKFSWLCATFWDLYLQAGKLNFFFILLYIFFLPTLWPCLSFLPIFLLKLNGAKIPPLECLGKPPHCRPSKCKNAYTNAIFYWQNLKEKWAKFDIKNMQQNVVISKIKCHV